jgi:hypothetical protein
LVYRNYLRYKLSDLKTFAALLLLFSCFLPKNSIAGGTEKVWIDCDIRVKNEDSHEWIEDIPVEIFCDGNKLQTIMSARDGKVWFKLEKGKAYDIYINRGPTKKAYITKLIRFDLKELDLQNWKYRKSDIMNYHYEIEILLFTPEVCEDFKFLNDQPMINYVYSSLKRDLCDIADQGLRKDIRRERRKKCKSGKGVF